MMMLLKSRSKIVIIAAIGIVSCIVGTSAFSLPNPALRSSVSFASGKLSNGAVATLAPRSGTTYTSLSMRNGNDDNMSGSDRVLSCLPYLLPILDGDRYGRFIFALVPTLGALDYVLLGPFKALYSSIPFLQFGLFIGLTVLARNNEIPRSIRYNMQQAVVVDILLIFPSLLGQISGSFMPQFLVESGCNFVFFCLVAAIGYSLVSNASGKIPNQIPVVSEAVEMQIGGF
mmetsp:Transcript_23658/g.27910  ORF Transcript_23658/g.27910 Transcript_23658/m.27910 type:complete len:230 (+) Transcript_23658:16-705(+)